MRRTILIVLALGVAAAAPITAHADTTVTVAAVGDMACDSSDPAWNGGLGSGQQCRQAAVSDAVLADPGVTALLGLGDYQYDCADPADWAVSYTPTWGRLNGIIDPAVGNHEYKTGTDAFGSPCPTSNSAAATYFGYFGAPAHPDTYGHYSFDVGAWHVVALNANCSKTNVGGCSATSAQTTWLRNDLATHPAACTLAYWHQPLYQGLAKGTVSTYQPWWNVLAAAHADVVLNGHIHNYQRFAPVQGITEYVVGTGGEAGHTVSSSVTPHPVYWRNDRGYLRLTLADTGWSSTFVSTTGYEYDTTTGGCS